LFCFVLFCFVLFCFVLCCFAVVYVDFGIHHQILYSLDYYYYHLRQLDHLRLVSHYQIKVVGLLEILSDAFFIYLFGNKRSYIN
jgi:hypothetical protein